MSIEKQAVAELYENKKFMRFVIQNNPLFDINKYDLNKLIEFFILFKKEKGSKKEREEMEEYERNARQKIEDEENERKRPSFSESLMRWMLLMDMNFNLFCKTSKNQGKSEAELASYYYTPAAIDFLKKEHEKKSMNSSKNQNDC